jgi:hypothetical protein
MRNHHKEMNMGLSGVHGRKVQILPETNLDSATRSRFSGDWVQHGFCDHCQQTVTEMHSAKISRSGNNNAK